jgi:hypothetical protein
MLPRLFLCWYPVRKSQAVLCHPVFFPYRRGQGEAESQRCDFALEARLGVELPEPLQRQPSFRDTDWGTCCMDMMQEVPDGGSPPFRSQISLTPSKVRQAADQSIGGAIVPNSYRIKQSPKWKASGAPPDSLPLTLFA